MPTTASWYHANVKSISRGKGKSYVGLVAYATGEKLQNPETGRQDKRNHPGDVVSWGVMAPSHAPSWLLDKTKIERLAQAVQASETRTNAQFSNHWDIALWRNGTPEQHEALARRISERYVERYGTLVVYAVHAPSGEGSEHNWHLHLAPNMRRVTEVGFGAKATEITDGKSRHLETEWVRRMIADETNAFLKSVNSDERVSHQSYRQRGILKQPMIHMGNNAWQAEKRGVRTDPGDWNREIRAINRDIEAAQELPQPKQQSKTPSSGKHSMEITEGQARQREDTVSADPGKMDRITEDVSAWWMSHQRQLVDSETERQAKERDGWRSKQEEDITDPRARWAEACGKYSDMRDPYGSLATAARAEGAAFRKEQEDFRQAEARESDPEKREILKLQRHISASDYMEITSERLAGISKVLGGPRGDRGMSESEEYYREEAGKYREIGARERELLKDLREKKDEQIMETVHRELEAMERRAREPIGRRATGIHEQFFSVPQDMAANAPARDRPQNEPIWRDVREGEVFDPGQRFRMDQESGKSQVQEERPQYAARENPYDNAARADAPRLSPI